MSRSLSTSAGAEAVYGCVCVCESEPIVSVFVVFVILINNKPHKVDKMYSANGNDKYPYNKTIDVLSYQQAGT